MDSPDGEVWFNKLHSIKSSGAQIQSFNLVLVYGMVLPSPCHKTLSVDLRQPACSLWKNQWGGCSVPRFWSQDSCVVKLNQFMYIVVWLVRARFGADQNNNTIKKSSSKQHHHLLCSLQCSVPVFFSSCWVEAWIMFYFSFACKSKNPTWPAWD